jgi:hypothetical protein
MKPAKDIQIHQLSTLTMIPAVQLDPAILQVKNE